MEAKGWPQCSLQLPEETLRGRCCLLLPGTQCQATWKMVETFIHHGEFRLNMRKHFFTKRVSNSGTDLLEKWLMPHVRQCWRGIWTVPLKPYFTFSSALKWSHSWTIKLMLLPSSWSMVCYSSFHLLLSLPVYAEGIFDDISSQPWTSSRHQIPTTISHPWLCHLEGRRHGLSEGMRDVDHPEIISPFAQICKKQVWHGFLKSSEFR